MKRTNQQLWDATPALVKLGERDLPITLSYRLAQILRPVREHVQLLDGLKSKLLEQYGKRDGDGEFVRGNEPGSFKVPPAAREKFAEDHGALMAETMEFKGEAIPVDLFGPDFVIAAADLDVLLILGVLTMEPTSTNSDGGGKTP